MTKRRYPGQSQFRQAMNCIGQLIFERGLAGDLDFSVSSRRIGPATTISVYHPEGVIQFTITDEERDAELTPRQRQARRKASDGDSIQR